jgi:hypothetical protein
MRWRDKAGVIKQGMRRARWDSRPVICLAKVLAASRRPRSTEIGFRTFHVLSCARSEMEKEK